VDRSLQKKGRISVCDEEISGRPSTSRTENNILAVERMIRVNRRITVDDNEKAYMFGPMKETLRGRRFSSDEEVIDAVQNWLKMQTKNFFF
jgi:ABC-type branched-subunit amino acid transport system ATPase component